MAPLSCEAMSLAWLVMPARTSTPRHAPSATITSRISAAPAPRGTPRRRSRPTSGAVTEAMSVAVITGTTIVLVRASSQTQADDDEHDADEQPRDEARVAEPRRRDEHPLERAGLDLEDLGLAVVGPSLRVVWVNRARKPGRLMPRCSSPRG